MNKAEQNKVRIIMQMADLKGREAAQACTPVPMVVGSPSTPFGNDIDYSKKTYFVEGGVCGFAWVSIRPATSSVARFAKKELGWRYNDYDRAMQKWVSDYGQSMQLKEAYADAFAAELRAHGIPASAGSRMD
ncbi:Uncharacterised protein [uncultured archaeon]|nr:Uncharacterised protein [uncultured archaeon]